MQKGNKEDSSHFAHSSSASASKNKILTMCYLISLSILIFISPANVLDTEDCLPTRNKLILQNKEITEKIIPKALVSDMQEKIKYFTLIFGFSSKSFYIF